MRFPVADVRSAMQFPFMDHASLPMLLLGPRKMASMTAVATLALMLNGCGESPVENKRSMAEFACLERSFILQGYSVSEPAPDIEADIAKPEFRFQSSGHFVVTYGTIDMPPPYPSYRLTCTGDFNGGTFTSVQVGDRIYRPSAGTRWPFQ